MTFEEVSNSLNAAFQLAKFDRFKIGDIPLATTMTAVFYGCYHLEEAEQCGIDFQLSGHTHRGQIWPVSWITDALYECSWGSHQRGNTRYYVSSGLGVWGAKFRIGTQSEYVVAKLNGERRTESGKRKAENGKRADAVATNELTN